MGTKICAKCGLLKDLEDFYKHPSVGYISWCRSCGKEYSRKWYIRAKAKRASITPPLVKQSHQICTGCYAEHPVDDFLKNGKQRLYCKSCSELLSKGDAKACDKCRAVKPLTEYYQSTIEPDGLFPRCKKCCKTHSPLVKRSADYAHDYIRGSK